MGMDAKIQQPNAFPHLIGWWME